VGAHGVSGASTADPPHTRASHLGRRATRCAGVKQDMLIPATELSSLAETINAAAAAAAPAASNGGGPRVPPATYLEMDSAFGHDAFLKEFDWLGGHIRRHLEAGLEAELEAEAQHTTGTNAP
jgi:homoserine acetyltransferase